MDSPEKDACVMNPDLSVIIACTRPAAAAKCLNGFSEQHLQDRFEVIVVGDIGGLRIEDYTFPLLLIEEKDRHANRRRNIGLARAKGDIIAFLDDDTIPDHSWTQAVFELIKPGDLKILTGPEKPIDDDPVRNLIYQVSCNYFSEFSKSHINRKEEAIGWRDVPFANLVTTRKVIERTGPLGEDIPWDMDDFDFCRKAIRFVSFYNCPSLRIRHDRYPKTIATFFLYRWRLRLRTGEKIISHPATYLAIYPIALTASIPFLLGLFIYFLPALFAKTTVLGFIVYGTFLVSQLGTAVKSAGGKFLHYIWIMVNLQVITVIGVWLGMVTGLYKKLAGRI